MSRLYQYDSEVQQTLQRNRERERFAERSPNTGHARRGIQPMKWQPVDIDPLISLAAEAGSVNHAFRS
jgi:hypothetical protein